ncbi:MAG: hypothetical protein WCK34_04200 [Bacteroidota bacterium]
MIRSAEMKTLLFIHPEDPSTVFLKGVYKGLDIKKRVITGGVTRAGLKNLIGGHDRVLMCGHGTLSGCFPWDSFSVPVHTSLMIQWPLKLWKIKLPPTRIFLSEISKSLK